MEQNPIGCSSAMMTKHKARTAVTANSYLLCVNNRNGQKQKDGSQDPRQEGVVVDGPFYVGHRRSLEMGCGNLNAGFLTFHK